MKKILMMLIVGGVIFGTAAGASWFLQNRSHAATAHHGEESADPHAAAPADAANSHSAHETHPPAATASAADNKESGLPSSVRPRPVSVEELLRYSLGLKSREEQLTSREKDVERRQSQVTIVLADIQGEQRELDGLRSQVKQQLSSVELLLEQIQAEREKFQSDKSAHERTLKDLGQTQALVDAAQADNVKKMSLWFQGMEPAKTAALLKEFSDDGKMEMAVQLLSTFGEREASKVLAAIEDPSLTMQLAEAFRNYRKPPKKEEKKR